MALKPRAPGPVIMRDARGCALRIGAEVVLRGRVDQFWPEQTKNVVVHAEIAPGVERSLAVASESVRQTALDVSWQHYEAAWRDTWRAEAQRIGFTHAETKEAEQVIARILSQLAERVIALREA